MRKHIRQQAQKNLSANKEGDPHIYTHFEIILRLKSVFKSGLRALIQIYFSYNKPFLTSGFFRYFGWALLILFLLGNANQARAGILNDVWKFFVGDSQPVKEISLSATVSLPLLGSHPGQFSGTGGPAEEGRAPMLTVQDGALIASRSPSGSLPTPTADQIFVYTVQIGDTAGAIAERFDISLNTLLWANDIRNASLVKPGDELIILPVTGIQYEVKRGDTLESIAKRFKGDPQDILHFNGLFVGEPLAVGSSLIIPDGEIVPLAAASSPSRIFSMPERVAPVGYYLRPIFGGRKSRGIHGYNGVDLADRCGFPVVASARGTVIITRSTGWNGGYGKYIVLSHSNGTQTLYAHLSSILASSGQQVDQSSQIGLIGSTGNSTGCHLHFEIRGAKNPF